MKQRRTTSSSHPRRHHNVVLGFWWLLPLWTVLTMTTTTTTRIPPILMVEAAAAPQGSGRPPPPPPPPPPSNNEMELEMEQTFSLSSSHLNSHEQELEDNNDDDDSYHPYNDHHRRSQEQLEEDQDNYNDYAFNSLNNEDDEPNNVNSKRIPPPSSFYKPKPPPSLVPKKHKKKGFFFRRSQTTQDDNNDDYDHDHDYADPQRRNHDPRDTSPQRQRFPNHSSSPPPPQSTSSSSSFGGSPSSSSTTPIHYQFPAVVDDQTSKEHEEDDYSTTRRSRNDDFQSPRRDLITNYRSTTRGGTLALITSAGLVGGMVGAFCEKSLFHHSSGMLFGSICFVLSLLTALPMVRNPYGELMRALGMAFILVLSRTTRIRTTYPSHKYLLACVGLQPRRPFPPATRNPWRYTPRFERDPEFHMWYTIIAMTLVGSACGGNLPLIPTWLGALAGAGLLAFGTTLSSARGDLCRCMGMRVVQLSTELWDIQGDLRLWPKLGMASSQLLDKLLILDRKHKIKDRLVTVVSKIYEQVQSSTSGGGGITRQEERQRQRVERERPLGQRPPPRRRPRRYDDEDYDDNEDFDFDAGRRYGSRGPQFR